MPSCKPWSPTARYERRAYIPGHGTPTVVLLGRNTKPVTATVRTVMGIKGEPATPADPAQGEVWSAIVEQVDQPGSESNFVSAADTERDRFRKHPWTLGGQAAGTILDIAMCNSTRVLGNVAQTIGYSSVVGDDDAFVVFDRSQWMRRNLVSFTREFAVGDCFRDWVTMELPSVFYSDSYKSSEANRSFANHFWPLRRFLQSGLFYSTDKRVRSAGCAGGILQLW